MTIRCFYNTIVSKLSTGGIIIKGKGLLEEIIESWHERPVQTLFALLLLWVTVAMAVIAEKLIIIYISAVIALLLFIGGVLLIFSTKPREYKSAAWMTGIAFLLIWNFTEDVKMLEISLLNATDFLELTAIAFILLGWFEKNNIKKYAYATIALFYIVATILSH